VTNTHTHANNVGWQLEKQNKINHSKITGKSQNSQQTSKTGATIYRNLTRSPTVKYWKSFGRKYSFS